MEMNNCRLCSLRLGGEAIQPKGSLGCALALMLCLLSAACQPQEMDDAALTARVKAQMIADGRVSATRVSVTSSAGVVTLTGEVPTEQEKQAAEQAAKAVTGVTSVRNQVRVNPATAGTGAPTVDEIKSQARETAGELAQDAQSGISHAVLLGKVKARLAAAGYSEVSVEITQGQAILTGEVASREDRIAAGAIVKKVDGIKQVNNRLAVRRR
jgi:osmotically-inducible protein OsmY